MTAQCADFWLQNPHVLLRDVDDFFPFSDKDKRCTSDALNSFTRFGILVGIALALIRWEPMWLLVGVLFGGFAVLAWFWMSHKGTLREGLTATSGTTTGTKPAKPTKPTATEGFLPGIVDSTELAGTYLPTVIGAPVEGPTPANPLMNVLLTEITDNPTRPPAASIQSPAVRAEIDQFFTTMFADDPGDVFRTTQSQRIWITQPSTTIPNDQETFQNWLYRVPGKTCKEGNGAACNSVTDGRMPWR